MKKKKYRIYLVVIIVLLLGLIVPILIYTVFYTGNDPQNLYDNILVYFGAYVSFSGTIVLGTISVIQARIAHQQNDRLMRLSETEYLPIVSIQSVKKRQYENCTIDFDESEPMFSTIRTCRVDATPPKCTGIVVELKNEGKLPICKVCAVIDKYNKHFYQDGNESLYIAPGQTSFLNICTVDNLGTDKIRLVVTNISGYEIQIEIRLKQRNNDENLHYNYELIK